MAACSRDGCGIGVEAGRLYGWRGDVAKATGLGRPALDRLERSGLLEIRRLGRRSFVRGEQLIEAIWTVAERKEASK
jgi:hypothetical protein